MHTLGRQHQLCRGTVPLQGRHRPSAPLLSQPARSRCPTLSKDSARDASVAFKHGGQEAKELVKDALNGDHRGGLVTAPSANVALAVTMPCYEVRIAYTSTGKPLENAARIWAHVGHSGWKDVNDVELQRVGAEAWVGQYCVPAGNLNLATHLEIQLAFKGQLANGHILWDNNGNHNWASAMELTPGEGLVTTSQAVQSQESVSRLVLRLESFAARKLLTVEQALYLRTLAWSKDLALLRTYERCQTWADADLARELVGRCMNLSRPGLHVVHIAAEMAPIAKVGGLADVVAALAKAHQARGTLAEIILPKYNNIDYSQVTDLREVVDIMTPWMGTSIRTRVWTGVVDSMPVYFLEPHSKENFFWRQKVYGCPDDVSRFLWFSRAALEYLAWSGKSPDVLHIHDWQTGAVAPMLKELYKGTSIGRTRACFTIHNTAFQGRESPALLDAIGLDRKHMLVPDRMQDDSHKSKDGVPDINILKAALIYADHVTTVSPKYAEEVQHTPFGEGLQRWFGKAREEGRFCGVLNGIDTEVWSPRVDRFIARTFDSETVTEGKLACKQALLQELKLPFQQEHASRPGSHPAGRPLLAVVTRLTEQKGLPLILEGLRFAAEKGMQVVVLGSAPDPAVQRQFEELKARYDQGGDVRIILRYDEGLSHRIYAGADMILIPSAFEPCGLTQLISMAYGTVPIVRPVGGLHDTVFDVEFSASVPKPRRNGFWIQATDAAAVQTAIMRALDAYHVGWEWWSKELVPNVIGQDYSWDASAQQYLDIYAKLAGVELRK